MSAINRAKVCEENGRLGYAGSWLAVRKRDKIKTLRKNRLATVRGRVGQAEKDSNFLPSSYIIIFLKRSRRGLEMHFIDRAEVSVINLSSVNQTASRPRRS